MTHFAASKRQTAFLDARADEVLFGGAAGGGKSYGQIVDAFFYAMKYTASKQLILRRTYPELERSLIRTALELYPRDACTYQAQHHSLSFCNDSVIDFGYCNREGDVTGYQSAEYDTIRFDELTHFTEYMYLYLISRLRGANDYPKQVKSSSNPGNVGHEWVKARFISPSPPNTVFETKEGSRVFLPSRIDDNPVLLKKDPGYQKRLLNLPNREKRALLYGDWDVFDGQYFPEFDRNVHVVQPYPIPPSWTVYRTLDYGLDMLACYWVAVDPFGRAVVFRELYESGLIASEAARAIRAASGEPVRLTLAPPDLWGRQRDTGRTVANLFEENGVPLIKAGNNRVSGWMQLKERLKIAPDETEQPVPGLTIFDWCVNLIRCLPSLTRDAHNVSDVSDMPHEITHGPDALRYFVSFPGGYVGQGGTDSLYREQETSFLNYGIERGREDFR